MRAASGLATTMLVCLLTHAGCGGAGGPGVDAADALPDVPAAPSDALGEIGSRDAAADLTLADASDAPGETGPSDVADAPEVKANADAAADMASSDAADAAASDAAEVGDGGAPEASACAGETLSAAESASYFPFKVGARWMFRGVGTSNEVPIGPRLFRREVTGTKMFGTASAAVLLGPEQELNPGTIEEYLEVGSGGVVDHGGSMPVNGAARPGGYASPFIAIPFPIQTCAPYQPYNVPALKDPTDADGDGVPDPIAVYATTTLTFEDVTVPIGTFNRALRVETVASFDRTYTKPPASSGHTVSRTIDWYAPGVGPIKRYSERYGQKTTSELIAYAVGDARRGVIPVGLLASAVDEASNNPYTPNRPAIGFDGQHFLVVVPTSKQIDVINDTGNLQAFIVDRDGKVLSAPRLLDFSNELQAVSIAWDGMRYLVAYHNASYGRVEMITVSPAGETISGPVVLDNVRAVPSVVATKDGFLVGYTKVTQETGTLKNLSNPWFAIVDAYGHPTSRVQPYPAPLSTAALATDDAGGVVALFYAPPATPSPTLPETANILAAARLTSDGHPIDATPFAVDAVPKAGHDAAQIIFDGTNFVATWSQQTDSSTVELHAARIDRNGALLDGAATVGGGVNVGGGMNPRIARFGSGSLMVWGNRLVNDFYAQGIGGTRFTTSGKLLDVPGDGGGRWFLSDYGAGQSSLVEALSGGDRALVVWSNQASQDDVFSVGCAIAYPW